MSVSGSRRKDTSNTPEIGFHIAQLLLTLSPLSNEQEKKFNTPTVKCFEHILASLSVNVRQSASKQ
jgi:hypothetical protein